MSSYLHLSVAQFIEMQKNDPQLQIADIRDVSSYTAGHIPGSVHLTNENFVDFIRDANMDKPLVVVCYHGISSQTAADYLNQQGFDHVYSLDGGFQAWGQQ